MKKSRFIAYRKDENNRYSDSDFYIMLLDTKEDKVIKHVYATTRFAGCTEFAYDYLDLTQDPKRFKVEKKAVEILKKKFETADFYEVEVGDIVKVTNPRARKFKEETFKVEEIKEFRMFNGRKVVSTTLFGEGIRTDINNVSIVKNSPKKISNKAFRAAVGMSY